MGWVSEMCFSDTTAFVPCSVTGAVREAIDDLRRNNVSAFILDLRDNRHGVRQMRTWAYGPEFITQCPIRQGESYTY
ncbi:laccase-2-like [Apium graveolens]|uniref:laccase-2-like n=1 Tax=Apium graveolens TaxID=4045 RepID=UPI003D79A5D8